MWFRYECPRCGELLETDASPGTSEICPACGRRHRIPQPLGEKIRRRARELKLRRKDDAAQQADQASDEEPQVLPAAELQPPPAPQEKGPAAEPPPVAPRPRPAPSASGLAARRLAPGSRYGALQACALVLQVAGVVVWLVAAACLVLWVAGAAKETPGVAGVWAAAAWLSVVVSLVIWGLLLVAWGQSMQCLRDIALSTARLTAERGPARRRSPPAGPRSESTEETE